MPTIDLSNNNQTNTTQTTPSTNPAPVNNTQQPTQNPPMQMPNSGWNDPWGAPSWGGGNQQGGDSKRLSPQERVTMIESAFNEILGRKPDTRDINYYKYSTLSEDEIKKQLITGNEHKQLLQDGRDYKKLKDRALQAETRVKVLEGQIKDQVEEFKQLTDLLKEKNKYIQELRERLNQAFNTHPFKAVEAPVVTSVTDQPHFTHTNTSTFVQSAPKEDKKITVVDRVKDFISDLL